MQFTWETKVIEPFIINRFGWKVLKYHIKNSIFYILYYLCVYSKWIDLENLSVYKLSTVCTRFMRFGRLEAIKKMWVTETDIIKITRIDQVEERIFTKGKKKLSQAIETRSFVWVYSWIYHLGNKPNTEWNGCEYALNYSLKSMWYYFCNRNAFNYFFWNILRAATSGWIPIRIPRVCIFVIILRDVHRNLAKSCYLEYSIATEKSVTPTEPVCRKPHGWLIL